MVNLQTACYELEEVSIKAQKPFVSIDNNNFKLSIENSYLQNEGSINNVLEKLPFVSLNSNNKISVVGKDNVVVYINNKKVTNDAELSTLNASNVTDIELINNPSAKYDATADAVVLITTKKQINENIVALINTEQTLAKCYSFNINPNIYYKYKNINIFADYTFSIDKSKEIEKEDFINVENFNKSNLCNKSEDKLNENSYTLGINFSKGNNNLSLQYSGYNNNLKPKFDIENQKIMNNDTIDNFSNKKISTTEKYSNIAFDYSLDLGEYNNINFSFNYVNLNNNDLENISEQNKDEIITTNYKFDTENQLYSYQINYTFTKNNYSLSLGGKQSNVENNSTSLFINNENINNSRFSYDYDFKEIISAIYLEQQYSVNGFFALLGLRTENTNFVGNHNKIKVVDTTYWNLFPSLSISYSKNNLKTTLNYKSIISRPSFSNLSPNIRYDNEFYYREGNPNLKTTITDDISLTITYKRTSYVSFGYKHKKNPTIFAYYDDLYNENVIVAKLTNHKYIDFLYFNAYKQFNYKNFSSTNSFSLNKPFAEINCYNDIYKISKSSIYFKTTNVYSVTKNFLLAVSFLYYDMGETLLEKKKTRYNLSLSGGFALFDKKLVVNMTINDILKTNEFIDYRRYANYEIKHEYYPDDTYFCLNIKYKLFSGKAKYDIIDNNSTLINRL